MNRLLSRAFLEKEIIVQVKILSALHRIRTFITSYLFITHFNIILPYTLSTIRDSVVGIATGYGQEGKSSSTGRVKYFLFSTSSGSALESTQPPIQWVPTALTPRVKRPGREAEDSSPAIAEVKKILIHTCTLPYPFMA
jgi:hypothetical protein